MDQNQYQPRRTDFQSVPSARRQITVNDASSDVPQSTSESFDIPVTRDFNQPVAAPSEPVDQLQAMDLLEPGTSNDREALLEPTWQDAQPVGYNPVTGTQSEPVPAETTTPSVAPAESTQPMFDTTPQSVETPTQVAPQPDQTAQPVESVPAQATAEPAAVVESQPQVTSAAPAEADAPARPYQIAEPPQRKRSVWKTQKFWLISVSVFFVLLALIGGCIGYKATHHTADKKLPTSTVTAVDTSSDVKTVGASPTEQTANEQRQKAMLNLRTYLENYYTAKVMYPTTVQMADPSWVLANLKGATNDMLKDPDGTTVGLATMPTEGRYAYQAARDNSMESCDNVTQNCNYYKLTAILTDGSEYAKTALH